MAEEQDTFKATEFEVRFVSGEPTRQRSAALMGTIFGMPILMFGIVLLGAALTGLLSKEGELSGRVLLSLASLPFVLFGGWIVLVGLRSYLTVPVTSRRPIGKIHTEQVYTKSAYFPKRRTIVGARKGFIALQSDTERHNAAPMQAMIGLGWTLLAALFFLLVWRSDREGLSRIFEMTTASTFLVLGLLLFSVSLWRLLRRNMARTAVAEVKKEPLGPGERTTLAITLRKAIPCDGVRISLQCREVVQSGMGEQATFTEIVQYESLYEAAGTKVVPGRPLFEQEIVLPEEAAQSFQTHKCGVKWGVEMELYQGSQLVLSRFYIFRVAPAGG